MRTKFTLLSNKLFAALFLLALFAGITTGVRAQAPFAAGQTYYVNGVGNDLVSPKDTFMNLTGAYTAGNPYINTTGVISALNANGIDPNTLGQITILLVPGYTGSEASTAGIVVNTINYASALRAIVMKPVAGSNFTITNSVALAVNTALFRFNGTQYFTIDGAGTPGQKNLSFVISATTPQTTGRVIDLISTTTTPINTVTLKNINITGFATTTAVTTYAGVYIGGASVGTNGARRNANISVINCDIQGVQFGVYARGFGASARGNQDLGLVVRNNRIGGNLLIGGSANAAGIFLSNQADAFIENNVISRSLNTFTGFKGIELNNAASTISLDSNIIINANTIHTINSTSGGVTGIRIALGNHQYPLALKVTNNTIAKLTAPGNATMTSFQYPIGILVEDSTIKAGIDIINNSIALTGATLVGSSAACLVTGTLTAGGIRVYNNIFSNRMQNLVTNATAYNTYAIAVTRNQTGTSPNFVVVHPFDSIDNNLYDVTTTGGWANIGYTILNNYVSVPEWSMYTLFDKGSFVTRPVFENDSTLATSNGAGATYASLGKALLANDIYGVTRPASGSSSVGAYQFTQNTTNAYSALVGGVTYPINGVDNLPTNANPTVGSFATYGSFVNHLNSFGTQGTGTINIVFSNGFLVDATVPPAILPYPGMLGTRGIKVSASNGVTVNLTIAAGQVICNNSAIIKLYGASFFEIDGNNGSNGKAITISLPASASATQAKLVAFIPTLMHTISYATLRNCTLTGSSSPTTVNTYAAVYMGAGNVAAGVGNAIGGANTNNFIGNNTIEAVRTGIYWRSKVGLTDQFLTIYKNVIGGTVTFGGSANTTFIGGGASNMAGIYIKGVSQGLIDSNIVRNSLINATGFRGIDIDAPTTDPIDSPQTQTINITRNTIYNLGSSAGYAVGIRVGLSKTNRSILIANNTISKIFGTGSSVLTSLSSPAGIAIESPYTAAGTIGLGISVIHNTVQLSQHPTVQVSPGAYSSAIYIDPRVAGVAMRNNLFSNVYGRTAAGTLSNAYVYALGNTLTNPFSEVNTNVYYVGADINYTNNQIAIANTVQMPSLFEFRKAYGGDAGSLFGEVPFLNDSTPYLDSVYVGHIAKRFIRNNQAVSDIAGVGRGTDNATAGAFEVASKYAPLFGDAVYYVNGTLAPPTTTSPLVGSFNTVNNLFRYINTHGVDDGNNPPLRSVEVVITAGYTGEGDTLITAMHDYPQMGPNRYIRISTADGVNAIISSTAATTRSQFGAASSVIRFQGARYVTIDGRDKNLTIRLPNNPSNVAFVNNPLTRVIDVIGWSQPATDITIRGCNILGYSNTTTVFSYAGIYQGGVAFNSTTPVPVNPIREKNNNNRFESNFIGAVKYGVYLKGINNISGGYDLNTKVIGNTIGGNNMVGGAVATDNFGGIANAAGILVAHQANALIDSNVIKNNIPAFNNNSGIELSNSGIPSTGQWNTDSAITITRNTIRSITSTTTAAYGIYTNIRWDGTKSIAVYNNMISAISALGSTPSGTGFLNNPFGILLDGTLPVTGPAFLDVDVNVWNNSINLGQATTLGTAGISACIGVGSNTRGTINVTNNILQNRLSRSVAGGNIYALAAAANLNPFGYTDYNNYYVAGTIGNNSVAGVNIAATATNYNTVANWAAFSLQDTLSLSVVSPFISDVNLLIPNGTSSPLYRAGQRIPRINNDILAAPRPGLASGVSSLGAHEFLGSYQDIFAPKAYDYTKPADVCYFDGVPVLITARIMDKNPTVNDTLYYTINGGAQIGIVATTRVGNDRTYTIPAQPANTMVAYRIGGRDGASQPVSFVNSDPKTGFNYTTTVMNISPSASIATGFDMPNVYNWSAEQIQGVGLWDLRSFGSLTNPVLAPLTGSRAAMLSVANGISSRLVSPCLDFTQSQRPTLRLYVSQNADNANLRDSILVKIGAGFGTWIEIQKGYPVFRANANFAVPGYKVYDFCLEEYAGFSGLKVGIEAYSRGGGNIIIDSIVLFDNFLSLPVTPKTQSNCYNDSIDVFIANADSKFEYTLFDMLTQKFVGSTVKGNDGTLRVQGYMATVDSAYLRVWARNITSNCTNFMDDTAIVFFRNFKNGPFVVKGSVFNGQYNSGDFFTPDAIKVGGVGRYQIVAPKGTTNANYGSAWTIARVKMYKYFFDQPNNVNVIIDSASSYSFVAPTPSSAGYVLVNGVPADSNKTFQLEVTVRLLPEGCDSIVNRYVTIANAPIGSFFAPNDTLCQNINNLFANYSTTGDYTLPMQFTWDFGDGTSSNAASPIKAFATPGQYTVKMLVRNNTTLLDSVLTNIVVLPSPVANFTSTISCSGKVSTFTSTGPHSAGNFYRFDIGGQVADSNKVDVIVQGSDTIINTKLLVRNTVGCTDTITKPIQVFAQPTASFAVQNVCAGAPVQFTNSSSIAPGKNGRVNTVGSEWTFGNGDMGYSNNPLYYYPAGGSYRAILKVISNYGCTDTISRLVSIYNKPVVNFTVDNTCKGSNMIIANNTTFANGLSSVKYNWNFGDNSLPSSSVVPVKSFGAIGSYYVTLTATDTVNGCFDSLRVLAQVKDRAMADFTAENGCVGKDVPFTNQSIIPGGLPVGVNPTYTYQFGDNSTSNSPNALHAYVLGGSKTINLIVDIQGCRDTATKSIVISAPIAISYNKDSLTPNNVRFTANKPGLARYSWNFGDGSPIVNTTSNVITHIFDRKGWNVVTLTVQDSNACDAIYVDSVNIDRRVGIEDNSFASSVNFNIYPNPFTSTAKIEFDLNTAEKVSVEVFDMLGRKVYSQNVGNMAAGVQSINLNENQFDAKSAVYMVRVYIGNDVISRQLIKQ
jgi:PKD repeat protein